MKRYAHIFLIIGLAISNISFSLAQQVCVETDLRTRAEYRQGYKKLLPDSSLNSMFALRQRSRVAGGLACNKFKSRIELQDSRQLNSSNKEALNGIYEAWAEYQAKPKFSIKVGRQELAYDRQKLLARRNWGSTGLTHDMVLLKSTKELQDTAQLEIHLAGGINKNRLGLQTESPDFEFYKYLTFLWASYTKDHLSINGIYIIDAHRSDSLESSVSQDSYLYRNTYGLYAVSLRPLNNNWKGGGSIEARHQFGYSPHGQVLDAYHLAGELKAVWKTKVLFSGGCDIYSGSSLGSRKKHTFSALYGANHKYRGGMDFFKVNVDQSTQDAGLVNWHGRFSVEISPEVALQLQYHRFYTQQNIMTQSGEQLKDLDRYLADEINIKLDLNFLDNIETSLGYAMLLADESLRYIQHQGVDCQENAKFAYCSINIMPSWLVKK